jgi:thiol-disulfide isomerase/thioredoxin
MGAVIVSRRAVVSGLVCIAASSALGNAPPPLRTNSAQFIEMRPLKAAPPTRIERIDGGLTDLGSFRGKVVLLSFWASWCPPCRRELQMLERLQQLVDPKSLEVVAVSIDEGGKPAVDAFLKRVNVTRLRPYLDPRGVVASPVDQDIPAPFILFGLPISYVIDRRGRVAGYIAGEVDWTAGEALALLKYYMARDAD